MYMYVFVCIFIYVFVCVYMSVYLYVQICLYFCMCIHMFVCVHNHITHTRTRTLLCVYVLCMCISREACVYLCVHTPVHVCAIYCMGA